VLKKIKNLFMSDYAKDILNSQKNLILVIKNKEVVDANQSFLNFFKTKDLKDFKEKYGCMCDLFIKEEGFLFGENWIETLLSSDSQCKVKIDLDNKEYIFKAEAIKFKDRIIVTLTDITDLVTQQRRLEEVNEILDQYKKAVDSLLIVSKTDLNGVITYVNDNFCSISGYEKEELIGKPHNIVRHPDMPKDLFKNLWNTIKRGAIWRGVIKNKKKDGGEYWVDAGIMPIKNHKGEIIEYIALRTDITELVKAKEKAQAAEKAKSIFLANMSHEIRTPLNAILGFTQLLENDDTLPEKAKEYIKIVNSSANTLLRIINDVLDLSKLDAGDFVIENKEFNPKETFTNLISLFKARAKEKDIEYLVDIDNLPNCIKSDEHRLKQVLANLISNAIKFTPKGGKVKVSIKKEEESIDRVKIKFSVEDTGIGIPKDKQKDIFKAFIQVDGGATRKYEGTGLGLTISSRIIRKLGSFIEVESEEEKGSKFFFVLEFEKCQRENDKENIKEDISSYKGNVLVAEDDEFNQTLIKEVLTRLGVKVDVVSNGVEAIEKVKQNSYDLIFLDINMPKKGGIEAVKEIKKLTYVPVIALTANVFKEDVERYIECGFDDFVSKPIDFYILERVLLKYLNREDEKDYFSIFKENLKLKEDVVKRLITIYFDSVEDDLNALEKAIHKKDYQKIYSLAHKIRGASSNLKVKEIFELTKEIEKCALERLSIDYEDKCKKLKKLIRSIRESIK